MSARHPGDPWGDLTPTQAMIAEVLTVRWRLGEEAWPFPAACRKALVPLAQRGLVTFERGFSPRTLQVRMTEAGREEWLEAGYTAPAIRLLVQGLHLCMNGERAPGGDETWDDWAHRTELFLRRGTAN